MQRHYHNGVKTAALLGLLSAAILVVGGALGGRGGLVIALVLALGVNGFSYFFSAKLALRSMRAYPVSQAQQPRLYAIVADLATRYRMPMPMLYLAPTPQPNAFATGRDQRHAAVCCTEGILTIMDDRELRGVLGHELSHVANRDILISSVAGALASVVLFLAQMAEWSMFFIGGGGRGRNNIFGELLLILLGPLAAQFIQLAISRAREYQADATGAQITGDPLGLASALRKLEYGTQRMPLPASASLAPTSALMIASPFRRGSGSMARFFATHPPIADRIARLEELAGQRLLP